MQSFDILFIIATGLTVYYLAVTLFLLNNFIRPHRLRSLELPLVSVIVAARNEEAVIG